MQLSYINVPQLVAEAGGDPWAINQGLQVGRPAQISDLAEAFHAAGRCTTESSNAFDEARRRFEASWNRNKGDNPINDSAEVQRVVNTLGTQSLQLPKIGAELERIAAELAEAQRTGAVFISNLEIQLQVIDRGLGAALAQESSGHLTDAEIAVVTQHVIDLEDLAIADTKSALGQLKSIREGYSGYLQGALNTLRTEGYDATGMQALDTSGSGPDAGAQAGQRQNQIDAFTKVFGRTPRSAADWETAAALDPHSYEPKNGGWPPNIVVGRIKPVPGQGVVRTNMFIPGRAVWDPQADWPPYHDNLGDNRGFSPTASPEESRVSIYVDYENGIIVARQNPSVDETTGQVRVGTPSISAVQQSNGSVLVKYSAADPFSPGGQDLAKAASFDVNGAIAIEPTPEGPRVGGTVTNFPAIEVYSDMPGGTTTPLVQSWPLFVDDARGPAAGLWWHKPIGDAALELSFNDQGPAPRIPAPPHSGHLPPVVPIGPALVASPSGTYPLGPADHPPEIGVHDPILVLPQLPAR
ncbi:putative alpha/beta hydrolase [Mycobacterium montefiorense]|uniref:Predicted hydrolase N-terminal domain-containing protein n=1 Tax=Mycobacterium montefiorense TaxID=154654 RepID=A0AA37PKX5_9MYCO|nr:hypothetical protein [Mycobacterium montefiorense]GBG39294.1 hypothetical protein MmonteBS_36660 [Mycobacterium montefiorense]GKU37680.1 hypothetical protein NJB14191_50260 [Mycobacterium montefiorense]GKU41885.1 hypothetical protein NJB14192_38680 [Mycobacterium montefiorense]GKU45658.1 hypothetical protein NJB14194_22790 [Mycobacterium montefiorense]GKU53385.1 hypothetical protein NJB14195_46260 [Mycobacterium montefiorense]